MARKLLDVKPLSTHAFAFDNAMDAYGLIQGGKASYVGILLMYEVEKHQEASIKIDTPAPMPLNGKLKVGFVGAGNYASLHLLPHLQRHDDVRLTTLVTATGMNAKQKAKKFKFSSGTTDYNALLSDGMSDSVFIATRHGKHAEFTVKALHENKNVFVEKAACGLTRTVAGGDGGLSNCE